MECLQILKFSLQKGRPLKFTEGMSWSDELKEFEHAAHTAPLGDPEAYECSLEESQEESDALEDALDELSKELKAIEEKVMNDLESTDMEDGDEDNEEMYFW